MIKLGLVVPCYNEEEVLIDTVNALTNLFNQYVDKKIISADSFIALIDDGSKDKTWILIESFKDNKFIKGAKLTRNRGHQNALLAGLATFYKQADALISIDADLQDDINAIGDMVQEYEKGSRIVYGVRNSRKSDSLFKKMTARMFYRMMNMFGAKTIYDHADFRLMSKDVIECLLQYQEVNLFLRGIVLEIGYPSSRVYYKRLPRTKGESKYPLKKMLAFAWNGITSFSNVPLKMIRKTGVWMKVLSILSALTLMILNLTDVLAFDISHYIICAIFFVGALILIALGIIGEYIGKIHLEVKHRPRYFIEKIIDRDRIN